MIRDKTVQKGGFHKFLVDEEWDWSIEKSKVRCNNASTNNVVEQLNKQKKTELGQ